MRAKWGGHIGLAEQIRGREVLGGDREQRRCTEGKAIDRKERGRRGGERRRWAVESNSPRMSICAC
jgi:hypothetical protein